MNAKEFLREKNLENCADAFKEGVEVALEQINDNIFRLSLDELKKDLEDRMERSKMNYEYAPNDEAKQFQQGYQAVCGHFLGVNV